MGPLAPWMRQVTLDNDTRARRWITICLAISILLHVALLLIPLAQHREAASASGRPVQGPLTVRLTNPGVRRPPPMAAQEPHKVHPPHPVSHRPPVLALRRSNRSSASAFKAPPPPLTPPEPAVPPEPDMSAMLEARRQARREMEEQEAQENDIAASAGGRSSININSRIMENINRSTSKTVGTGGMFQVTKIGVREGEFIFNGWHPGADNWHESHTVDAGVGGDVRLAIVKEVIKVIRKHKKGDFDFESHRLGHPVTMSARPADNAALESFLMRELFGDEHSDLR
ncbi:MAG: hypothetical protein ACHP7O_07080 [Burkholderiales bacterium]